MPTTNADHTLGLRVSETILASTTDVDTLAQATHLTADEFNARLHGDASFSLNELVMVGGLLGVPTDRLMEGIA